MLEEMQILVVDDNCLRREAVCQILDFLGEKSRALSAESCIAYCQQPVLSRVLGIVLGELTPGIETVLTAVSRAESGDQVPVGFLEGCEPQVLPRLLGGEQASPVVGLLAYPLRYADTLTFLHRCQLARENKHAIYADAWNTGWLSNSANLIGNSLGVIKVREMVAQVARSDASVLILGESGVGKEVVARQIHEQSLRHKKPFVAINCGAIPAELLESELFGHEKGAFTGAFVARQGRFELAQGGTLFLDEIGDMPLAMQVKLLRILQEKRFERIGSNKTIEADVRIVAATHRNLEDAIAAGNFRQDLFYRLNVFPIRIPALRERQADVPLLIADFLRHLEAEGRPSVRILPTAMQALMRYPWPGNVRELSNLVERLTILYPHGLVDALDLPDSILRGQRPMDEATYFTEVVSENDWLASGIDLKSYLHDMEVRYIQGALKEADGVVSKAAALLKMRRTTLVEKLKKFKLDKHAHTDPVY